MKRIVWKSIAEFLGISALVASLIFLGLQMKQQQEIAKSENDMAFLQSQIEIRNGINEHAVVWSKARTAQPLDPAEHVVFENLVIMLNDAAFYHYTRARRVDEGDIAQVILNDYAAFLFQNPPVRRLWVERENSLIGYRRALATRQDFSFWKDSVTASLSLLDRSRDAERGTH